jgi:hypothetical protein
MSRRPTTSPQDGEPSSTSTTVIASGAVSVRPGGSASVRREAGAS